MEMTVKEIEMSGDWKQYWGGDAPYDVAGDLENTYEDETGKSACLWTPSVKGDKSTPKDTLADRPEEYITHGYTGEFEDWGVKVCTEAIEAGCADAVAVEEYVMKHHGKVKG